MVIASYRSPHTLAPRARRKWPCGRRAAEILDHNGRVPDGAQLVGDDSGQKVGGAARRKSDTLSQAFSRRNGMTFPASLNSSR
jgi:hypothetical protein